MIITWFMSSSFLLSKHWQLGGRYTRGLIVYQQRYRLSNSNKHVDILFRYYYVLLDLSSYSKFIGIDKTFPLLCWWMVEMKNLTEIVQYRVSTIQRVLLYSTNSHHLIIKKYFPAWYISQLRTRQHSFTYYPNIWKLSQLFMCSSPYVLVGFVLLDL